ncbi:MAG: ABC transporter substrate-binding protein [Rhizobiales bacterium]|nr:ABC transporter substrate-binding protein [Hyphomicrobiales bacterium]
MRAPFIALCVFLGLTLMAAAEPRHGIAMHGEPALPPDFSNLPYANPHAPQGGVLRQAITGSFDSLNPFIVMGQKPFGSGTYVVESLLGRNWGEPFSLYGLLAESIDVSDDRQTVTFRLRPEAKFSDGTPVTAEDVVFSMETLRDKGLPRFKTYYSKVKSIETPDERTIVMKQDSGDRELPLLLGLMPIIPKHYWKGRKFDATSLDPFVGSGPYMFGEIRPGESIVYRKNPDYWGRNLPFNRGLWNFDEIRLDYFRDSNAAFEAFKKGLADFRVEADPVRWSTGYDFPAAREGKVVRETIPQKTPAPTSGLAFNTRRPIFADPRVREALIGAFDFEWANANLFSNLYQRTYGYYSGSELSSRGLAADARELALLGDAAKKIPPAMLDGTYQLPQTDGSGRDRRSLRKVVDLLKEAGYEITDKGLVNVATGEPFTFTISVASKEQEKIALHYQRTLRQIGIDARVRLVDAAQFSRVLQEYDFDMAPATWYNSLSPGNEQSFYFGSAAAKMPGTRNYPGIADPDIDRIIDALTAAETREELVTAVHALDRLLVAGHYIVPLYDAGGQWVALWNSVEHPVEQPLPGFEASALWRRK